MLRSPQGRKEGLFQMERRLTLQVTIITTIAKKKQYRLLLWRRKNGMPLKIDTKGVSVERL